MCERSTIDAMTAVLLVTLCAGVASGSGAWVMASGDRGETLREPPVVASSHGVLTTTLIAGESQVSIGNQGVTAAVYNGGYLAPTLRARAGDVLRVRLVNRLGDPTNLHLHGLSVSPSGNSDDVFLHVPPAGAQDYEVRIPSNHAPGLYWYHPHPHGHSDDQVRNGMSGALIVEGLLDPFPALHAVKERLLLLKDVQIENGRVAHLGIGARVLRTVNGLINPTLVLHPGETELWRIGNVGGDLYYQLTLDGLPFYEVARDGHRVSRLVPKHELLLEPGAREEVLVQAPGPGTYTLRTAAFDTGPEGNHYPGATLATVRVEGAATPPLALPERLFPVADWRGHITGRRTIVFSEADDGNTFFVDGRTFDPSRIDTRVRLGAVEEWTIRNESGELHDFHIHQTHFQVTEVNGVPQPFVGYQDIVNLPIHGAVKVVIPFTDPVIVGKFVYHCHLLSHEDRGMMATIVVTP